MTDRLHRGERAKELGRSIGLFVIDDQDVLGVQQHLGQHGLEILFLIINRDGRQKVHCRISLGVCRLGRFSRRNPWRRNRVAF